MIVKIILCVCVWPLLPIMYVILAGMGKGTEVYTVWYYLMAGCHERETCGRNL